MNLDLEGKLYDLSIDYKTGKNKATFLVNGKASEIEKVKDIELDIKIKKHRRKRTLNANDYFWCLLQQICQHPSRHHLMHLKILFR